MSKSIFKYCPRCSHELERRQKHEKNHHEPERLICPNCEHVVYENPVPTVSAVIINNNNETLLAKRAYDPKKGDWDQLGGFLEPDEDPKAGVKREVKEEAGIEIEIIGFIGIYTDKYPYNNWVAKTLNIYYLAKHLSGIPKARDDVAEVKWFGKDNLPANIAAKNNRQAIDDWLANKAVLFK
jgi:ADP-ribose pyrophosphatase YjhB (NUDIX family)